MTRKKIVRTLSVVLVWCVIAIGAPVNSVGLCPSFCDCDIWYELQRASCIGRHLYSIHTGAPSSVQALDVSNNSISALNNYELKDAGLSNLKYLNLSVNAISEIGLNAFNGLSELTVLDLSQNHLYYLLSDVFISTQSLRILRMSKNNFNSHIPKLECPWLTDLFLDSCQISHIPEDMFNGLKHLRKLDLSNNLMIQLNSITLLPLAFLRQILLEGNPWSCNEFTFSLQKYLTRMNIDYRAVCGKPSEPKKFEKMIVYNPQRKYEKHRPSSVNIKKNVKKINVTKNFTSAPTLQNATTCVNGTKETSFIKTLNAISPYWFFTIGFLLGSACSIFICYIWLKGVSCCRGCHEQRGNDIQRASLLQSSWHLENSIFNESTREIISCPDTPPPPYREVMLRPRLYRSPSEVNDNTLIIRTGYT